MTTFSTLHDARIERPCYDPWGRTPHFERVEGSDRGVLYVPSYNGQWSGIGCTIAQACETVSLIVERRLVEPRALVRCRPGGGLAGIEVDWTWDPARAFAHAYDGQAWWEEGVAAEEGQEVLARALCGEVLGELRSPAHDEQSLTITACGGCVRALSVRKS